MTSNRASTTRAPRVRVVTWPTRWVARPWLWTFVPINAATSGFGVLLPLIILRSLHGRLIDVAVATALFNGAVILASIVWGRIADEYPNRRTLLVVNFGGFAALYLALGWVPSLPVLFGVYALIGALAPAGASAGNLLILERFSAEERATAFASFQEMSIVGAMVGVLAGFGWLLAGLPLLPLVDVLAALAALAAVLVVARIPRDGATVRSRHIARHPESLVSRLRHSAASHGFVPFFPRRPGASGTGGTRIRRHLVEEFRHELPLILVASLLFNLTSSLFNTAFVPYLNSVGVALAAIFLVNFANAFGQSIAFPLSGGLSVREGPDRLVQQATYVRAVGYLVFAGFTFVVFAPGMAFGAAGLAFGLLGVAIAFYSTASTLLLFRAIQGRDAGSLLGINSAVNGVAAVLGAILAGVITALGGYRLTFLISAGGLLASVPLWAAAEMADRARRQATPVATPPPVSAERVPPTTTGTS